jgi:hypothetical protein
MLLAVSKRISSVQQAQTVDILDVTFLKIQSQRVFFRQEVNCIQSLCLGLCNWWDVGRPLLLPIASKVASRILDDNMPVFVVEQGPRAITRITPEAIQRPWLREGMDQVRPSRCQIVVHSRTTTDPGRAAFFCDFECHQGDKIPDIGVEDLLVGSVS